MSGLVAGVCWVFVRSTETTIVTGNVTTREALSMRWAEIANDPLLRELPYKIALSACGKIEMSPANNRPARLRGALAVELGRRLTGGGVLTECPVLTGIGVRVPDVAGATSAFFATHGDATPYPAAPEICVEIVSPSNAEEEMQQKLAAYLAAGAREVWIVSEDGSVRDLDAQGAREESAFDVRLAPPPRAAGKSPAPTGPIACGASGAALPASRACWW